MKSILEKARVGSWILYDAGNSAFGTIIVTAYFILYFKNVIVADPHRGDFLWGISNAVAMLILSLASPVLGALADAYGFRKKCLIGFTLICIFSTTFLSCLGPGSIAQAMLLFILALVGYEGGIIFYDSFLSQVSQKNNIGKISGYGFAAGYLGGVVSLLVSLPFIKNTQGESGSWSVWPFYLVAIQFLLLSLPAFALLHDYPLKKTEGSLPFKKALTKACSHLIELLRSLREYLDLLLLLIAYFLYFNAIITVITFAASFAHDTLGFSAKGILLITLLANSVAVPGAIFGGWLCDRIGGRNTILLTIVLWGIIVLAIALTQSKALFVALSGFVGIGLGATQGATRALYARFVPKGKEGKLFSLKGICGKFSGVIGPFLFGSISYLTSNQRWAAASLLIFFIAGFLVVYCIDERRGIAKGMGPS